MHLWVSRWKRLLHEEVCPSGVHSLRRSAARCVCWLQCGQSPARQLLLSAMPQSHDPIPRLGKAQMCSRKLRNKYEKHRAGMISPISSYTVISSYHIVESLFTLESRTSIECQKMPCPENGGISRLYCCYEKYHEAWKDFNYRSTKYGITTDSTLQWLLSFVCSMMWSFLLVFTRSDKLVEFVRLARYPNWLMVRRCWIV